MKKNQTMDTFLSQSLHLLGQIENHRNHPFRFPVLGTTDTGNGCTQRVVIMRQIRATDRSLDIFTDHRSSKIQHLRHNPNISLLFYHPEESLQIRMGARADIHWKNDVAAAVWRELPPPRRRDYCAVIPPGSPLSEPGDGLPVNGSTPIRIEETEFGFENFAVLRCRFHHLDILQLDPAGHRRAVYQWREGRWSGQWVVP